MKTEGFSPLAIVSGAGVERAICRRFCGGMRLNCERDIDPEADHEKAERNQNRAERELFTWNVAPAGYRRYIQRWMPVVLRPAIKRNFCCTCRIPRILYLTVTSDFMPPVCGKEPLRQEIGAWRLNSRRSATFT